jgi:uncharacterized protein (DUF885 family)
MNNSPSFSKEGRPFLAVLVLFCVFSIVASDVPNATFTKIENDYWQHLLEEQAYFRLKYGLPIDRLPDPSYEAQKADAAYSQSILDRLKKLDPKSLGQEDFLSYKILQWQSEKQIEGIKYFWFQSPVTPYSSQIPLVERIFADHRFSSAKDTEHYVALLQKYPVFMKSVLDDVRESYNRGIIIPTVELEQVLAFLQAYQQPAEKSVFFVNSDRLGSLTAEARAKFQNEVANLIETKVNPATKAVIDFLSGDYKSKAPAAVGLSQYPGGKEAYKFLAVYNTTMDVTPEAVHEIGLKEVARINGEMQQIRDSLGFKGTKAEFHQFLKTDPRFFPKTPEEIGEKLMAHIHRIEPKVDEFFLRKPHAPYGVKRLNPALEPAMTFGYYQEPTKTEAGGFYFYNGSKLDKRSLLVSAALIYHELIPGHHFQICLQSENESLPQFRRNNYDNAFLEGWGEYASLLAGEMGMYTDPYDHYGRLAMEIFLSSRLVVDTGMNYLGWSREKAMEFMKENTLYSDAEIATETLRYSTDIPAQALAYRMGSNKIYDLREEAKQKMKDRFDIRKFHDAILGSGSMPMTVLEQHIDWFISAK